MSISYFAEKIKPFYTLLLCVVIASIFFALGRLSAIEERHAPVKILQPENSQTANVVSAISAVEQGTDGTAAQSPATSAAERSTPATGSSAGGTVIASKNGSKYYFPWCGGIKLIKPENQVKFASADEARKAGYTPAGNCKGLK